jgi:hypothetical protein
MNVLIPALRGHPEAVDRLVQEERVLLEHVTNVIRDFELPFALSQEMVDGLVRGQPLGYLLAEAYLGVVSGNDWGSQVQSAAPAEPTEENPFGMTEWVTFASGHDSSRGLSLPDDDDSTSPRLSLFAQDGASLQRASVEFAQGVDFPPTGVAVSWARGCSLPDWGQCRSGECDGACVLTRVVSDPDGLVCHCPHLRT